MLWITKYVRGVWRTLTGNLQVLYGWCIMIMSFIGILAGVGPYSLWVELLMKLVNIAMDPMQAYKETVIKVFAYMPYAISKEIGHVCDLLSWKTCFQYAYWVALPLTVPYVKPLYRWCMRLYFLFWLSVTVVQVAILNLHLFALSCSF
jgi:hypothetical protein